MTVGASSFSHVTLNLNFFKKRMAEMKLLIEVSVGGHLQMLLLIILHSSKKDVRLLSVTQAVSLTVQATLENLMSLLEM